MWMLKNNLINSQYFTQELVVSSSNVDIKKSIDSVSLSWNYLTLGPYNYIIKKVFQNRTFHLASVGLFVCMSVRLSVNVKSYKLSFSF